MIEKGVMMKFVIFAMLALIGIPILSLAQASEEKPNALIEVSVNGVVYKGEAEMAAVGITDPTSARQFLEQNSILIPKGGHVRVKLELLTSDGLRKDITSDGHLYALNVADWIFQWERGGLIRQGDKPIYAGDKNLANAGIGQIMFVYKDGGIYGYNRIFLKKVN